MRSDASLDDEIKALEQRIHDRRLALRQSVEDIESAAVAAKERIKQRAASPLVWGGALVAGFLVARFARRPEPAPRPWHASVRFGKQPPPAKRALAAALSAALPIALRIARSSAGPMIARAVRDLQQKRARRRAYQRYAAPY